MTCELKISDNESCAFITLNVNAMDFLVANVQSAEFTFFIVYRHTIPTTQTIYIYPYVHLNKQPYVGAHKLFSFAHAYAYISYLSKI